MSHHADEPRPRASRSLLVGLVVGIVAVTIGACGASGPATDTAAPRADTDAPIAPSTPSGPTSQAPVPTSTTPATTTIPDSRVLFDFTAPEGAATWRNQNDTVMGGRSESTASAQGDALSFAGNLSLENNGGFVSVISEADPSLGVRAAGSRMLRIRAAGDGRTYIAQARVGARHTYIQRFSTVAGVTQVYELPIAAFQPVTFMLTPAQAAPPVLDPATLSQLAFYLTDKQAGPFALRIERIDAAP